MKLLPFPESWNTVGISTKVEDGFYNCSTWYVAPLGLTTYFLSFFSFRQIRIGICCVVNFLWGVGAGFFPPSPLLPLFLITFSYLSFLIIKWVLAQHTRSLLNVCIALNFCYCLSKQISDIIVSLKFVCCQWEQGIVSQSEVTEFIECGMSWIKTTDLRACPLAATLTCFTEEFCAAQEDFCWAVYK